jgi:hypothetical protein
LCTFGLHFGMGMPLVAINRLNVQN